MKKQIITIAILSLVSSSLLADSARAFSIRPTAYYVKPTAKEYSGAMAGGLLLGSEFGTKIEHELSVEWAYTWWDSKAGAPGISLSAREHYMPLLLNYRYHFGSPNQIFRPYAGPSIGFTYSQIDVDARVGSVRSSRSTGSWAFTAAGSIGALIKLSSSVSGDLGYRYLHAEPGHYSIGGYVFTGNAATAHMAYAGINLRF